jgi:sugar lactone lactonase YvrE
MNSRYAALLVSATLALTGCGGNAGASGPIPLAAGAVAAPDAHGTRAGWMSPRARSGKGLLYVTDNANSAVDLFDVKGSGQHIIGQITDGVDQPNGIATDSDGNLYVANSNNTLTVYAPGSTTPSSTYTQGLSLPIGVAVRSVGRFAVGNLDGQSVTDYVPGSMAPSQTISFSSLEGNSPYGLAFDGKNDLYVAALGYPTARAYELTKHSSTPSDLGIAGITVMHGIAVDRQGNVLIANQGGASIEVFPPGSSTPSQTITDGLEQPLLIALNKKQTALYVADAGITGNGTVRVYAYPAGTLVDTITFARFSIPFGVALSP